MTRSLEELKLELSMLRRGSRAGHSRPHKLVMLLAVLDMIDASNRFDNRIAFNADLIQRFEQQFNLYKTKDDLCQPAPPFFHLRSSSFWKHKVIPGKEADYAKTSTSGGGRKRIDDLIEYAYIDEAALPIFAERETRAELRRHIKKILEADR